MGYCKIHGHFDDDYCRDCRATEERAEQDREEMLGLMEATAASQAQMLESINNPGDYDCPHCRFKTLRRDATRCPKCHGEISDRYWRDVEAREEIRRQEQKRRAEEEKHRRAEELRRLQEEAARERARQSAENRRMIALLFMILLLVGSSFAIYKAVTTLQERFRSEPMKVVYQEEPKFYTWWRTGKQESVLILFTVDKDGSVKDATARNATDSRLVEPALEAIQKWRFEPALKRGTPVATRAAQQFVMAAGPPEPIEITGRNIATLVAAKRQKQDTIPVAELIDAGYKNDLSKLDENRREAAAKRLALQLTEHINAMRGAEHFSFAVEARGSSLPVFHPAQDVIVMRLSSRNSLSAASSVPGNPFVLAPRLSEDHQAIVRDGMAFQVSFPVPDKNRDPLSSQVPLMRSYVVVFEGQIESVDGNVVWMKPKKITLQIKDGRQVKTSIVIAVSVAISENGSL